MGYLVLSVVGASVCSLVATLHGASVQGVFGTYISTGVLFLLVSLIVENFNE